MPKVVINSNQGLHQVTGAGVVMANSLSLTPGTITAAAEAEAAAATTLGLDETFVIVTSGNADRRIYLPAPADVPAGKVYFLTCVATGYELSSKGDGTNITTINGTNVTLANGNYAAELAVAAEAVMMCIRESATSWRVVAMADGGTPGT
jgi:hypothetical protein